MGGGKSSQQQTQVELPPELEEGAIGALGGALQSAGLAFTPNRGVTIAGFSPQQQAAQQGANQAAGAFGLPIGQGSYLPPTQMGAGGVQGYSTGSLYDQNVNASMTAEDIRRRNEILQGYTDTGRSVLGQPPMGGK